MWVCVNVMPKNWLCSRFYLFNLLVNNIMFHNHLFAFLVSFAIICLDLFYLHQKFIQYTHTHIFSQKCPSVGLIKRSLSHSIYIAILEDFYHFCFICFTNLQSVLPKFSIEIDFSLRIYKFKSKFQKISATWRIGPRANWHSWANWSDTVGNWYFPIFGDHKSVSYGCWFWWRDVSKKCIVCVISCTILHLNLQTVRLPEVTLTSVGTKQKSALYQPPIESEKKN